MSYIKSPLNYVGGKYKLLPQILPLFPNNIDTFVDVFGGGASVSLNVNAKHIVCNDIVTFLIDMFNDIKNETPESAINKVEKIVAEYQLSKMNEDGFKKLRNDYNSGKKDWQYLYTLICHSFNDQYRFNGNHEYNSSFGKNRSYLNEVKKSKLINFILAAQSKSIKFTCSNFKDISFDKIKATDFVYFDPPYSITTGNYNDGKRGFDGWCEADDIVLTNLLDELTNKGIKWAMSNVLTHKGKENYILNSWLEENKDRYIVHHLSHTYSNCNYHDKTGTSGVSDEVLICNYHKCGDCANFGDCKLDNTVCEFSL